MFVDVVIAPDGRTVYAPGGNTVFRIRTATNTAAKPIMIGSDAISVNTLAMSPNGKTLYVAASGIVNPRINFVVPVSTVTNKVGKPIKVGMYPDVIAFIPDGKTAFVATESAVYPMFSATGKVGRPIRTGFSPLAIVIAPDGRTAWVTGFDDHRGKNFGAGYLLPISTATDRPGKPVKLGRAASCLIMRPWQRGPAMGPSSCSL